LLLLLYHPRAYLIFVYALSRCLEDLGVVPQLLIPDNLKAAVINADQFEPEINQALEDFC
ncbi:MAG: hypothetical protein LPJ98_01390, partial [Cyclobacteriaceae bacterium]|nr:hypothetical protein [Cyclobacteriaceae bacterium]